MDMHFRDIYNVFDLLGDLGGVTEVLILMFYLFITPLSEHSFTMKALSQLFLARTTDSDLFAKPDVPKNKEKVNKNKWKSMKVAIDQKICPKEMEAEVNRHYPIKLSFYMNTRLFCLKRFGILSCYCLSSRADAFQRLKRLYDNGSDRLEKELSIERVMKNIRDMKILINSKFMTEEERFKIEHNYKNVIDLEVTESSGESSEFSDSEEEKAAASK